MKFGLCHGVQTTMDLISGYTGYPKDEIDFINAGINHMDWFLTLTHKGKDIYPILKANMEKPEYFKNEKVRGEVMRHSGYFMTESTGHLSEYLPWFRSSQEALDQYCDEPMFGGEHGAYLKFTRMIQEKFKNTDVLSIESGELEPRSKEYCSYIIEAIITGKPFRFSGNVSNKEGYISNLPRDATVEVPVYADQYGLHPMFIGELPLHLAAMNQSNITTRTGCPGRHRRGSRTGLLGRGHGPLDQHQGDPERVPEDGGGALRGPEKMAAPVRGEKAQASGGHPRAGGHRARPGARGSGPGHQQQVRQAGGVTDPVRGDEGSSPFFLAR